MSTALDQVRQLQSALPALGLDFPAAEQRIHQLGARLIGSSWNEALFTGRPSLEVVCLFPKAQLESVREALRDYLPEVWQPDLAGVPAETFQLFHLLVLLLTRRLHLGDVLLHVFDDGPAPEPRPEALLSLGWLPFLHTQYAMVTGTLRFLLTVRHDGAKTRRVPARSIPVHLGWTEGATSLLEDLLSGREPLPLHRIFELLRFLEISIPRFVRYLYFVESAKLGTSRGHLAALEAGTP
jgi:hypothetical protein